MGRVRDARVLTEGRSKARAPGEIHVRLAEFAIRIREECRRKAELRLKAFVRPCERALGAFRIGKRHVEVRSGVVTDGDAA